MLLLSITSFKGLVSVIRPGDMRFKDINDAGDMEYYPANIVSFKKGQGAKMER